MKLETAYLPRRFANARDQAITGHVAEDDTTDAKLAKHSPWATGQFATMADTNQVAGTKKLLLIPLVFGLG